MSRSVRSAPTIGSDEAVEVAVMVTSPGARSRVDVVQLNRHQRGWLVTPPPRRQMKYSLSTRASAPWVGGPRAGDRCHGDGCAAGLGPATLRFGADR
jgi:hypothetical protein